MIFPMIMCTKFAGIVNTRISLYYCNGGDYSRSTRVLPRSCPLSICSIRVPRFLRLTRVTMLSSILGFQSVERCSQRVWRKGMGQCWESIPIKETPLKIKGKTLMGRSGEATLPQQVTTPQASVDLMAVAKISPPTVSITPAQRGFKIGGPVFSRNLPRSMTFLTPKPSRNPVSGLPDTASTVYPSLTSIAQARDPTPPVAPVTRMDPWSKS